MARWTMKVLMWREDRWRFLQEERFKSAQIDRDFRADEELVDPKKYLEERCKPKCVKYLFEYQRKSRSRRHPKVAKRIPVAEMDGVVDGDQQQTVNGRTTETVKEELRRCFSSVLSGIDWRIASRPREATEVLLVASLESTDC
ncbi:hypothetical protein KSP40_PGU005077 [Platanthera guangdongensis]|uniref:Uncharacterized protein n=1 Tax=Platanthera guangdongensis TaxID=2320717 RepID=A0ABR2M3L2_9ASPA